MNEKYIVEGPALAKLLRENRIRIARGELTFTPLVDGDEKKAEPVTVDDEDNKDIPPVDEKVPTEVENVDAPSEDNQDEEIWDSKEVAPEDSKEVAPEEESKDVAPSEDNKDIPPVETKSPKKGKK
ncbi:hypothetical protein [Sodaliphilus pleomorphus]|uniref:Uncharacterized protein n=1 Tax=Sodaliphilus pleomorphus TaxID=2606626 RepID=A0A6L5XAB9_9BACT|nr:hypothetical protein [Sodaliphilus pleomorphus]MSS16198.1 hypothetical protein [Sodaliphilus pleomorphus]